jgi:CRISPR-associated protein Cas1
MSVLYITEQGATVGFTGGRIVVRKNRRILQELPVIKLEQIVAVGNINITPAVITYCLQAGIEVSYLSSPGHFAGRLQPEYSRNVVPRQRQYQRASEPDFMLAAAKAIVAGKIRNMMAMVKRQRRLRGEDGSPLAELEAVLPRVEKAAAADSLYGFEGSASAAYFKAFRAALRGDWVFDTRNYHPPTDPVNAILSLGYTMLYKDMHAAISIVGLDPYLGCFHKPRPGHAALASDLMEEHRAVLVDRLILTTLNKRVLAPQDFEQDVNGRFRLARPAFKKFLKLYADALNEPAYYPPLSRQLSYRHLIEHQVRHYARVILGDDAEYRPYDAEAAAG